MSSLLHNNDIRLDPQAQRIIDELSSQALEFPFTANEARAHYELTRAPLLGPELPVESIETLEPGGSLPQMTLFRPLPSKSRPRPATFLFFHGGGWTVGSLTSYGAFCRRLCQHLNANIIFVDYRLAPENPFPGPLVDSEKAARWVFAHAFRLGLNPERIGVLGDSAGGNLAAALAISNRDGSYGRPFHAQVLIYPCLDLTCDWPSHRTLASGYLLTSSLYRWYIANYIGRRDPKNWKISPLFARKLSGVAPAVVLHAGFDPLQDEAKAFIGRLREEKVPVKEISFPDMMHGFATMAAALDQADHAVLCIRAALHTLLSDRLRAA